jgi:hypothetical protein
MSARNEKAPSAKTLKGPFHFNMARPERFELPTTWFVARYSIQLSYGRVVFKGGDPTTTRFWPANKDNPHKNSYLSATSDSHNALRDGTRGGFADTGFTLTARVSWTRDRQPPLPLPASVPDKQTAAPRSS